MAETIVNFVLEKLIDVAVKEVLLIHGVDEKVEKVRRDLERIQAFLKDADRKHLTDERQKHWVKEVRDVAHLIEDVIDTFLLEVPPKSAGSTGCTGIGKAMKRFLKKTEKLPAVRKLADEINKIQTRMEEIKASRETFGINNLGEGTGVVTLPVRPPVIPDIDPNVVGFKKDLDHVANLLLDETVKRRSVISIWGVGGLGKTTLAQKVYNRADVKTQFELRIWIDISQKFELIDILRKIGEELKQPNTNGSLGKLHQSLREKKYLIVLDDIWTNDLWTQIGEALPDENNGSRVLLSTRSFNVAKQADPACDPYELGLLTKELSLELLLKKAFPNQDPTKIANYDLSHIIDQFVHKCNGLPIALVVLGGLLATKPLNHTTWSKVLQTMWFADGEKIIGTSYEDLPFGLKSCFMYFAAFPEDYKIDAKTLLRLWVAEGFIPKEDKRTLEETAESFLEDLVQRSMVQVTSRSMDGSIEYCRIHDLLRDLALKKAKEDNFLIVYSHPDDQHNLCMARRVAVHNSDCDEFVMSKNLRTLLCFRAKCMPNCSKRRMLKVVSIESSPGATIEINLEMFEGLTQLRYLDLDGKMASRENRSLGKMIGNMKFLQTVSARAWIFNQLRLSGHKTLRHVTGFEVKLSSSAKLPNLQTLDGVSCDESWEAPYVPNLRTLRLEHSSSSWEAADAFLRTLENLISLNLKTCLSFNGKLDMRDIPFYQNLQSLYLYSHSKELIDMPIDMPHHLTYLFLDKLKFRQDIMPALEKLQYLKELRLLYLDTNEKMCCSGKGFSHLEYLSIHKNYSLKDWEIEEGAMPILRELDISLSRNFCVPQGLRYLTNLQRLVWHEYWSTGAERAERVNEIRSLCKHVPSVHIVM